ncbi:MAG: 2-desacetyl-2-hydroxyethylbacteriochlorophyllide dehydrogenase BchC [Pseudomonadota bacterium]
MHTTAVILREPGRVEIGELPLSPPSAADIVVATSFSGISTGTERLLWSGRMPPFPGLGYPLVPGYEAAGFVVEAGPEARHRVGDYVFVPGANCYGPVRGLFGAAASHLVTASTRAVRIDQGQGCEGALLALAATAYHAIASPRAAPPELIIGHGVLGRLLARLTVALGHPAPTVWEEQAQRQTGAIGYNVTTAEADPRRDYRTIYDASGDATLIDTLIARLARGGELVLAGFYDERPSFAFPPAFMREIRLRVAAEWQPQDLIATRDLVEQGRLSLAGLITHTVSARDPKGAYAQAFEDPACLKMILDWSAHV